VCITKETTLKGIRVLYLQINTFISADQRFDTFEHTMYMRFHFTWLPYLRSAFPYMWGSLRAPAPYWLTSEVVSNDVPLTSLLPGYLKKPLTCTV
jgi:hypothetical protein